MHIDWGSAPAEIAKLRAEIDKLRSEHKAALALLEEVSYRLRQGKVWAGMSWTYTPIHPTQLIRLAEKVDALRASQAPKESNK